MPGRRRAIVQPHDTANIRMAIAWSEGPARSAFLPTTNCNYTVFKSHKGPTILLLPVYTKPTSSQDYELVVREGAVAPKSHKPETPNPNPALNCCRNDPPPPPASEPRELVLRILAPRVTRGLMPPCRSTMHMAGRRTFRLGLPTIS